MMRSLQVATRRPPQIGDIVFFAYAALATSVAVLVLFTVAIIIDAVRDTRDGL